MGKQIFTRLKETIHSMENSTDMGYTKTYIPWNEKRGFSVECERFEDNMYDENGELVYECKGKVTGISVYYQEDGKDIDCCTLSDFSNEANMKSLKEFVKMYKE